MSLHGTGHADNAYMSVILGGVTEVTPEADSLTLTPGPLEPFDPDSEAEDVAEVEAALTDTEVEADKQSAEARAALAEGKVSTCDQCGKVLGEICATSSIVGGHYCSAKCVRTAEERDADEPRVVRDLVRDLVEEAIADESDKWVDSVEDSVDGKPPWAERSDEHKWIEYRGDRLAIRTPKQSAITSYGMQVSDGSTPARKSKASRQIVQNHMSPDSFDRVMDRMGDPDDDYSDDDLGNVVTQILELRTGPLPQPNRAQRRHPNS